jgi:AcrR family transcriptional regulator
MARITNEADYAARRSEILAAAQQFIYTKGYEQMTIQDILDALGMSKGAFYHYFDSKPALLEALIEHLSVEGVAVYNTFLDDPNLPTLVKLERCFEGVASWKMARRDYLIAILRAWYQNDNALVRQKVMSASSKLMAPLLADLVRSGVQEGVFNTPFPEQAGGVALTLMLGLGDTFAALMLSGRPGPEVLCDMQNTLAAYTDALERLLGAPRGALHLLDPALLATWVLEPEEQTLPPPNPPLSPPVNGGRQEIVSS